jgi:Flp pilus assembly protein TadG
MVEFVLCFMIFILFVFGVIDISRLIFDEHGLTRATEAIAHTLAADYQAATPAQPFQINSLAVADAIAQAHADSDLGLDSTNLLDVTPAAVQYQVLSNSTISVCASPDFTTPDVIKVTINAAFDPVLGKLVGGRSIHMSQTTTVLTYIGELNSGTYQTTCP